MGIYICSLWLRKAAVTGIKRMLRYLRVKHDAGSGGEGLENHGSRRRA